MSRLDVPPESAFPPDLEIIRPLGQGAVATVLLARESGLKRLVAVKVLRPELAVDQTRRQRFEREAQAAASISHPNVTSVYRVGRLPNDLPFIVMEYIEGRTLEDLLAAHGTFSAAQTQRVMLAVAQALAAAHRKGIIHRDVRAANIMLENGTDRIVLMDFGFAALADTGQPNDVRLTRMGEIIGDPLRMSPEQRAGEPVTQQSDIYALGVLGYELLTGTVPNERTAVVRPDVAAQLSELIARCLAPAPRRRPDALAIANSIVTSQGDASTTAGGNPLDDFLRELQKRKVFRAMIAYLAGAFVLLQGAQLLLPALPLNDQETWYRGILAVTMAGFPVALAISWLYDVSMQGIRRTTTSRLQGFWLVLPIVGLLVSAAIAFGVWLLLMT